MGSLCKRSFYLGLILASPTLPSECPRITVLVYNYAAVPNHILARAEKEAGRIYGNIGVDLHWRDCAHFEKQQADPPDCRSAQLPTRITIQIVSRSRAQVLKIGAETFGSAVFPEDGGFGVFAIVRADRAQEPAREGGPGFGVLLGHLIAHELGHLMLGIGGHSPSGVMHVPWNTKQLEMISQGTMSSMPWQAEKIRAGLLARTITEGVSR